MLLLRLILIFALIYYLVRLFSARLFSRGPSGRRDRYGGGSVEKRDYSELTDQKIDDADYEDL